MGALPPVGTFVTGYRVYPFVGLIEPGHAWKPQETEVETVLEFSLAELVAGHEMKRLVRKGVPIKTPTYTVDGTLVWGATGADRPAPAGAPGADPDPGGLRLSRQPADVRVMSSRTGQGGLSLGDLLSGLGAVLLLVSLWRPWYELRLPEELHLPGPRVHLADG